jgi:hypothetical protein
MSAKQYKVVLLPGDGVGPEVVAEAKRVLELVAKVRSHKASITFKEELIGGAAIDTAGKSFAPSFLLSLEQLLGACRLKRDWVSCVPSPPFSPLLLTNQKVTLLLIFSSKQALRSLMPLLILAREPMPSFWEQ